MKTKFSIAVALALPLLLAGCGGSQPADKAAVTAGVSQHSAVVVADYHDVVQRTYVAFYGRPADPAGLQYWANAFHTYQLPQTVSGLNAAYATDTTVRMFVDAFGNSDESQALYPGDNSAFISAIYRNLYSREPDAGGKAFWVDVLDRGVMTRPTAALWIMSGAQSTDITIINNKVAVAAAFTTAIDSPLGQSAYSGMDASAVVREMLAGVGLDTNPGNFPGLASTIAQLANACGWAGCNSTRYLAFIYGGMDEGYASLGLVSTSGGTAFATSPGVPGHLADYLVGGTITDNVASNYYLHSMIAWKGNRLYRQKLVGYGGLPTAAIVSTLNLDDVCSEYSEENMDAYDLVSPPLSYEIYRGKGADAQCSTDDDPFFAVRMDMAPTTPALIVDQPLHGIHNNVGGLTGFLVRNGQSVRRVDRNFTNPVTMFTLPAADLASMDHAGEQSNTWLFTSGGKVYAFNASGAAGQPAAILTLGTDETVDETLSNDTQDVFFTVRTGANAVRVMRYNLAAGSTSTVGNVTLAGFGSATMSLTATRVVIVNSATGAVYSLPRSGGSALEIQPGTMSFNYAFATVVGERIWLHYLTGAKVVSVNSDGSGVLNFAGAYQAGCVMRNTSPVVNTTNICDHILMVEGDILREYDGLTGALRLAYGSLPATAAGERSMYALTAYALAGQGAVLTRVNANLETYDTGTVSSYYFKVGQAGLTPLVVQ